MREDFIICGYEFRGEGKACLILGGYRRDNLAYVGTVELPIGTEEFRRVTGTDSVSKSRHCELFPEFLGADWLDPVLCCTVEHGQRIPGVGLQNPVFAGFSDKPPSGCCI